MCRRAAALVLALAACRAPTDDAPAESEPSPALELPVQRRGETVATATLRAGADVDLWRYCERAGVSAVAARGQGGRFVSGSCSTRAQRRFTARWDGAGAAVVALQDGAVIAEVGGVETIALVADAAAGEGAGAAERADLVVVLPDGKERVIAAAAIVGAAQPGERGERGEGGEGKKRDGRGHGKRERAAAPLSVLLALAGVELAQVAGVTVEGKGKRRELSGATLRDPEARLGLRYNRRGQLRFGHSEGGREINKLRGVERVVVRGR